MTQETDAWTMVDAVTGKCDFSQVGRLKSEPPPEPEPSPYPEPEPEPREIVLPDLTDASNQRIAEESARVLRLSAMRVFERLGHDDWLFDLARSSPKEFLKLLQRLLPQAIEQNVTVTNAIPESIRNLTIEDLLAMRSTPGIPASRNIVDVEFTESKKPPRSASS